MMGMIVYTLLGILVGLYVAWQIFLYMIILPLNNMGNSDPEKVQESLDTLDEEEYDEKVERQARGRDGFDVG